MTDDDVIEQLRTTSLLEVELGAFATRDELVAAVLEHIYQSEKDAEEEIGIGPTDLDAYFGGIIAAFDWNADPQNSFLRRVAFEAASYDYRLMRPHYRRWLDEAQRDLEAIGLTPTDAATASKILNNMFLGFVYDITVNGDPAASRAAFLVALAQFRRQIARLVELS